MISKFDSPENRKDFEMNTFQGIEKLDISFTNSEKLIGKDYKITIRKYKNGKLIIDKSIVNTKAEKLPKINANFKFSIIAQHMLIMKKLVFFP
jgi:hypothetical protein